MQAKFLITILLLSSTLSLFASLSPFNSTIQSISTQLTQALQAAKTKQSDDSEAAQDAENVWYNYSYGSSEYAYWGNKLSEDLTDKIDDEEQINNLTLAQNVLNQDLEDLYVSNVTISTAPADVEGEQTGELDELESLELNDDAIYTRDLDIMKGLQDLDNFISTVLNQTGIDQDSLNAYVQQTIEIVQNVTQQYNEVTSALSTINSEIGSIQEYELDEEVAEVRSEQEHDTKMIQSLESVIGDDVTTVENLNAEIGSLESEIENANGQSSQFVQKMMSELKSLKSKVTETESEVASMQEDIQELQQTIGRDNMQIMGLQCPECG